MTTRPHLTPGALAHAIVAEGLADPDRLLNWRADPRLLRNLGVDPSTVDLASLADFAGMSEKVRHNPCRDDLQLSFRLLMVSGMEIELFRDYTNASLERRRMGLNSTLDRISALARFVDGWAPDADPVRSLIRDVIGHESVLAKLRRNPVPTPAGTVAERTIGSRVPVHNGHIVVRCWTCDPRQVARVLCAREPDLHQIDRGSWTFVYHKPDNTTLRMLEMDRAIGDLLLAVDNCDSLDDLANCLDVGPQVLDAAVDQLAEFGLLLWRRDEKSSRCE